ncbi:Lrp/AsnC family transcriptional regulator [Candidatus Woesearchaeota archaeon]|nr:Lrp/AsnC family transcriptional regulator [Candidatus Woesearchaeota archaeon]
MLIDELDIKDRKILYILCQEARTPPSVIAKQVGLSKDAVKYRIRQLEKKGVIYNYITLLDMFPLRYLGYELFIKFNIPPEEAGKISEYFDSHPNICWSCHLSGEWDYFAELLCSSNQEFHSITKDLAEKFGEQLVDYDFMLVGDMYRITQIIDSVYDGKGIELKDIVEPTVFPTDVGKRILDDTEKKMLAVMGEHATLPIHVIAKKAGLTPEVVRYRMRKMRQEGLMIRNTAVIAYQKLGFDEYIVLVNMRNLTHEKEEALRMRLQHNRGIKNAFRTLGRQTMFALVNTRTLDELESFLKSLRTEFFGTIKSINYYHITQHGRFTLFPDALQK